MLTTNHLTIGDIIYFIDRRMSASGSLRPVVMDFDKRVSIHRVDSYRGFYDQAVLCMQPMRMKPVPCSASHLRALCEQALSRTFHGYKGGSYRYSRATPVWVAEGPHDCSRIAVVGLELSKDGSGLIILTERDGDPWEPFEDDQPTVHGSRLTAHGQRPASEDPA